MANIDIKWYGDQILDEIQGKTEDALYQSADELLGDAESKAPKRTGALKDSSYKATAKRSTYKADKAHRKEIKPLEGTALAGFAMFYAHMVEFGTSKMAAQPFVRPALDSAKERIGRKFVIVLARNLK
jgi:HK97 gp10 family phage protein